MKTDAMNSAHPNLNLTPEEKRVYGNLLKEADPDGFGAVSGDVAVKFFERTRLPPDVLGVVRTAQEYLGYRLRGLRSGADEPTDLADSGHGESRLPDTGRLWRGVEADWTCASRKTAEYCYCALARAST